MILILEDNSERVGQFQSAARSVAPGVPTRVWTNAPDMLTDLVDLLEMATLISLDHDLNPIPGDPRDPGTGYDVAKFLGQLIPCCPVIVHTSNGDRANWMGGELTRGGWRHRRIYPIGEDWIAGSWADTVHKFLTPTQAKVPPPAAAVPQPRATHSSRPDNGLESPPITSRSKLADRETPLQD